jgi:hypothetical protein
MAVHGKSLKRFLPFYKSSSLVASSSTYNWLWTDKFFANNICCFAKYMLNLINQYTILWKSIERLSSYSRGYTSDENSPIAPLKRILKNVWSFCMFPLAQLNRSVNCLWKSVHWLKSYFCGYFSQKVSLVAPQAWNLKFFWICEFFSLSTWIDR